MEKRLRSSLRTSAEEFLSSATKLGFTKSSKTSLRTLIFSLKHSSELATSLPLSLHRCISESINCFKSLSDSNAQTSPKSPPTKRLRRSSRHRKNEGIPSSTENAKQSVIDNLQIYAYISSLCIKHPEGMFSASDLLPGVSELHDNLILLESDSTLLSEIANLCEEWWKGDLTGKETLISQSLPFLLSRSLTLKKKVDVHRVYSLRETFMMFDFEDESIEDLKHLLIRCMISPLYLKTEEGRKFLAFMFSLSGHLVKEALAMIRSQIPYGRKSMLEAYGEIVFRAWKAVEGESKDEIENGFLQGLIESAIHSSSGAFAALIRRVLGRFISQRTTDGVEKLLFRLAEPVIFRSLQVANSNVRQNALHLLLDLFPLEDPEATKEVKDTLLNRQFFLLEKLLMDECPDVRVVAVEGGCRVLRLFWEVIPSQVITKILTKTFDCLAHDTCTEVRLSTVNGLIYLLGNPHAHEVLKVLLPRLGHLILDTALSVRAAIVDLLLLIRDIRNFQFHKVVQLDSLLSALANDHPLVGRKITKLLIPSYFPSKVTQAEACNRFVALIRRSPAAGARFCEFAASEGASLESLKELFRVLISLTLSPGRLDTQQIDGALTAASYLVENLTSDTTYKAAMKEELSGEKLKSLFAAAATSHAQSSVCKLVTSISPDIVDGLFEQCMDLIMNCSGLCNDIDRQVDVKSAHKMVLSCDWFDHMFETMAKHLEKTAHGCHAKFGIELHEFRNTSNKRRKTKAMVKTSSKLRHVKGNHSSNTNFGTDYSVAIGIAWQIKEFLSSESTCKAILGSRNLETAFFALKVFSEASIQQCLQCDSVSTSLVLAYSALTLHMSLQNVTVAGIENLDAIRRECLDSSSLASESVSQKSLSDFTIDHLLYCANKLLIADDCETCENLLSVSRRRDQTAHCCRQDTRAENMPGLQNDGSNFSKLKRISNTLKMLTAVLKFIVDATAMGLLYHSREKCLKFTLEYVKFIISNLTKYSNNQHQLVEEHLKETFFCLRSSFTYAAKFLGLLLKNSSEASLLLPTLFNLGNELFDFILSIEECLGYGPAARFVSTVKPWMPDLILALGYWQLLKQDPAENAFPSPSDTAHLWVTNLARTELHELQDIGGDEETVQASRPQCFSAFNKLVEMMIQLLMANSLVLDAIGVVFLNALLLGLERKDFDFVLGLLHFVCKKLVGREDKWEELKSMLALVQLMYPRIEMDVEDTNNTTEGRQKLESARLLLEPVWMQYFCGEQRNPMEKE